MYVYMMGAFNLKGEVKTVKIGVSNDLNKRIAQLQTGQILEIKLIAAWHTNSRAKAFAVESDMHRKLASKCMRGEWFYPWVIESAMYTISDKMGKRPCIVTGLANKKYVAAAKRNEQKKIEAEQQWHDLSVLSEWRSLNLI
ncbi:GIY-YIG nuclease family protein [Rhodanobacter lindaniclasticus]|uniref:Bacteriophage T5 Orf172 DNA-binding domain-containing protein n=1 Tax=Rhodanobacter lindaniclasticus TaxID=75310 RepID=A0A4V3USB9_9GAMM|nr:GIY-YIG nuclease family protein [Rhodanobacter lindaniclasticus]THD06121.1 hypothetical protein B1991_14355 [Rhodanobacter lindaniclasticus]